MTETITRGSSKHAEIRSTYDRLQQIIDDNDALDWEVVANINYIQGGLQTHLDLLNLDVSVPVAAVDGWMGYAQDCFESFALEDFDEED